MTQAVESEKTFVVELLTTLRQEKFSPPGWWHFLQHAWNMSRKTANTHSNLKRSWLHTTCCMALLSGAIVLTNLLIEGPGRTLRLLPIFLFCVTWQQMDLFWHLGLNRQPETGKLLPKVGMANFFTWLRGLGASYLLGRLLGGISTPTPLALLVFLGGVVTDILDGQVARYTRTQSKLGQIGDGEADFCLYLAIAIILIQNSVLPLWLGLIMLLRFCIPLVAALTSYFFFAHPVHFGSTLWGKLAGLAQCVYFLVLLAPPLLTPFTRIVSLPLLVVTLLLLVVAPLVQIAGNV